MSATVSACSALIQSEVQVVHLHRRGPTRQVQFIGKKE